METRPNNPTQIKAVALQAILEQVQAGASIDEALLPYGMLAAELRPLVEIALVNQAYASSLTAPQTAQALSRVRYLNAAQAYAEKSKRNWWSRIALPRLALTALIFLAVIVFGSLSSVAVSAKSLPGDLLYPVKIAGEQTRLLLVRNPNDHLSLEKNFDDLRAQEIRQLVSRKRSEMVRLAGEVTSIQPDRWIVRNTQVLITPDTHLEPDIETGFYIEVNGWLQADGSLTAVDIRARLIEFTGTVDKVGKSLWTIDGMQVQVTRRTVWLGNAIPGSQVNVKFFVLADGSFQAYRIQVLGSEDAAATWTTSPEPLEKIPLQPIATSTDEVESPELKKTEESSKPTEAKETDQHKDGDDDHNDSSDDHPSDDNPTATPKPGEDSRSGSDGH